MDAYTGQIVLLPIGYTPEGWQLCDGTLLSTTQYVLLFSLLGTRYGGDGVKTFAVPNLQGLVSYGAGSGGAYLGSSTGSTTVTLNQASLPTHAHALAATSATGTAGTAAGNTFAAAAVVSKGGGGTGTRRYSTQGTNTSFAQTSVGPTGGGQPHNNMQPYVAINYFICLGGIFPNHP